MTAIDAGSGVVVNFNATLLSDSVLIEWLFGFSSKFSVTVNAAVVGEKLFGPFETVCDARAS